MSAAMMRLADRPANGRSAAEEPEPDGMPTLEEIRGWPATVSVPDAGRAFGLSRSHAYALAQTPAEFPARLIRVGGRIRVVTASIIKALSEDP